MIGYVKNRTTVLTSLLFVLFGLLPFTQAGQSVLFTDQSSSIYEYNPVNCEVRMLFKLDLPEKFLDLTFDTAGNLYLLTLEGKLFIIDQQTRSAKLVYSFLNLQTFTSVCCSKSNIVYHYCPTKVSVKRAVFRSNQGLQGKNICIKKMG